jgi:hypothetical protein
MKTILGILLVFSAIILYQDIKKDTGEKKVYNGTAWFLNDQGYVVTAYHVVKGQSENYVVYKNKLYKAFIFAVDYSRDLVILRTEAPNTSYLPLDTTISYLEPTITYGYPLMSKWGTNLKSSYGNIQYSSIPSKYYSSAKTCHGNSGGPVIGANGVLGIVNYGMPPFDKDQCSTNSYGTLSLYVARLADKYGIPFYSSSSGFSYRSVDKSEVVELYSY